MRQCRVSHCTGCGLLPGLGLVQAESRCVRDSVLTGGRYGEELDTGVGGLGVWSPLGVGGFVFTEQCGGHSDRGHITSTDA